MNTVAEGSALRVRYFDVEGTMQTNVVLSTVPVAKIKELAESWRAGIYQFHAGLGNTVIDISVDLEEREQIIDFEDVTMSAEVPPIRGAGFLHLVTVHGRAVGGGIRALADLVIAEDDGLWNPTGLGDLALIG